MNRRHFLGLGAGLARGQPLPECARLATALAASAVGRLETGIPPAETLEALQKQVVVEEERSIERP